MKVEMLLNPIEGTMERGGLFSYSGALWCGNIKESYLVVTCCGLTIGDFHIKGQS